MPHQRHIHSHSWKVRSRVSQGMRLLTTAFVVSLAHGCTDSSGGGEELEEEELHTEAEFELPVEVIGAPGTKVSRSFELDKTTASNAKKLYLRINNLSYENKARVRVNGGEWVSLNHKTVSLYEPEKARGGMVHGGYNTVRMTLPLPTAVKAGKNEVEFEFRKSDGISIGYRVIGFNLIDAKGNKLLNKGFFQKDDPDEWEPPFSDDDNIQAGKKLWSSGRLKSNYLKEPGQWYGNSIPPSRGIKATCADCHTADGRDLEIFAYSNHSIIERAKFHGLTEREGKQIASYIRSLSESDEKIGRYGRPWNPPFQPGPSVAERPVHEWPAGAGLSAVLENDEDMLKTMFPGSEKITKAEVNKYFDRNKLTDPTVQPLAIQFPDWKHWLPLIHPKDAFSDNDYWDKQALRKEYERIRKELKEGNRNKKNILKDFKALSHEFRQFLAKGGKKESHWRTEDGDAFEQGLIKGISKELAATSLARLQAVKFFELHTEFSLMGMTSDEPDDRGRQFIGNGHQVFNPPPHFTGCYTGNCDTFDGQSRATGDYETTVWYQLQQVLNPGNAAADFLGSMDYNYQPMYILRASASSDICEPVRYFYSQLIHYQTRGRTNAPPEDDKGFFMRQMGPWQILGADNRNSTSGLSKLEIPECLNDIQEGLGPMFVDAQLRNFLAIMDKNVNDTNSWPRRKSSDSGDERYLEDKNISDSEIRKPSTGELLHYAQKIYASMDDFLEIKVDCATFNEYRRWADKAWPKVNWDQFKCRS